MVVSPPSLRSETDALTCASHVLHSLTQFRTWPDSRSLARQGRPLTVLANACRSDEVVVADYASTTVKIKVKDNDKLGKNDTLGTVFLPVCWPLKRDSLQLWLQSNGGWSTHVHIAIAARI